MNTDQTYEILAAANTKIQKLLNPDCFYVALVRPEGQILYYPCIAVGEDVFAGHHAPWHERAYRMESGVLPDQVIATGKSVLLGLENQEQIDRIGMKSTGEFKAASWLGVPLLSGSQSFGALVVEKTRDFQAFGENSKKLLETIAQHVSLALQNTSLYQRLDRRVQYLGVLNEIGQKITANVHQNEPEILETIYREASKLPMDTSTMYIAFFDIDQDLVTFPLVYVDGKRINLPSGDDWTPRRGNHRRTEWVIKNKKAKIIRNVEEAQHWYQEMAIDYSGEVFASWIGAPMVAGDEVLGEITVRHTDGYKYDENDLEVLQILASQAAVGIQNFRLYNQKNNAEKLAMMSEISAEFVHRMNNLAGTIPVRADLLRRKLEARQVDDPKILHDLDAIDKDARQILDAARLIKEATNQSNRVNIDLVNAVETALARALAPQTLPEDAFKIKINIPADLPVIRAARHKFLDVLTNIFKNGLDAMVPKEGGTLTISAKTEKVKGKPVVEILVEDSGIGISDTNLTRIFDLFFTTKSGGMGFGLWRDRFIIRELGGDILVRSMEGWGSAFTVFIPIDEPQPEK